VSLSAAELGAIIAAAIAGLISLLGLIISKEQKVSEFRQGWIDALRADFSSLAGHLNAILTALALDAEKSPMTWATVKLEYIEVNRAFCSIRLRLNPAEHKSMLAILRRLEEMFAGGAAPTATAFRALEEEYVVAAQVLLKNEWIVVKRGEPFFRIAALLSLGLLLVAVAIVVVGARSPNEDPPAAINASESH
jgi:hypothetical protein